MAVIDASVVVDWIAPAAAVDSVAMQALVRLTAQGAKLAAPGLLVQEVGNALLTGVRRGRWSGAAADTAFLLLRRLPITLLDDPRDLDRAWDLARRYDEHPIYDMVYVALAERLGDEFITADDALRRRLRSLPFVVPPA